MQISKILWAAGLTVLLAGCGANPDGSDARRVGQQQIEPRVEIGSVMQPVSKPDARMMVEERQTLSDTDAREIAPAATPSLARSYAKKEALASVQGGLDSIRPPNAPLDREVYGKIEENGVKSVFDEPVSTFSVDVDSGSYALVRRDLNQGHLPATDAVRVEELINYFDYAYSTPVEKGQPFNLITEVGRTPWNPKTHLVHVGIKGMQVAPEQRPASNLVFLIDVSGSMDAPDKLPLLKSAFKLLLQQLNARDRVSLVVYAGSSGVVLEPTPGNEKGKILAALEQLSAGGSTHGAAGIQLAYAMAEQGRIAGGINRVILATDGDFNVGVVDHERLMDLIAQKREQGIGLTTLGFGQGNYNDYLMEQLADKGNGNYAYIDTINEAQKVLVDELTATLETIAKDVKIQIEWNPEAVAEYRLIGYENRLLAREDFNNDKVDAGDIGAGHSVTVLYEIVLRDGDQGLLEPMRYAKPAAQDAARRDEIAMLRLRYKEPDGSQSKLLEKVIATRDIIEQLNGTSDNYRFSAAVAGFGQLLRGGRYTGAFDYQQAAELARKARGEDKFGYRGEFLRLVNLAASLGT